MEQTYIYDNTEENKIDEFLRNQSSDMIHGIMMFNIDDFATINNELGIEKGNEILDEIYELVCMHLRGTDLVIKLHGDEYVVLVKNPGSITNIEKISEKILKALSERDFNGFKITASIGVSVFPFHGSEYRELKDKAIQSMARAKANGKNRYRIYESALTKTTFNDFEFDKSKYDEVLDYNLLDSSEWDKYFKDICLRIFYNEKDPYSAINSIMEIFCLYYGFDRAFVITDNEHQLYDASKMSFSIPGFEINESPALVSIRKDLVFRLLETHGNFAVITNQDTTEDSEVLSYLSDMDLDQILFFAIGDHYSFTGGVVFENSNENKISLSKNDLIYLKEQINIMLSYVYILNEMNNPREIMSKVMMFDGIDACIYIIDAQSHIIKYMNSKALGYVGAGAIGNTCHKILNNTDIFCEDCPLRDMDPANSKSNSRFECFSYASRKWSINLLSWLSCVDNRNMALLISIDIDNFFDELEG
ncbi:MAG: GGDEF domain-containing protein [Lachnospiraceae bacterium]|nr:GGDEF domain-containing protein [Lachnospiraceae bacterium]